MSATTPPTTAMGRVFALTGPFRLRALGAVLLAAGTIWAAMGLMGTSGHLLSRAAEGPPIMELMLLVVAVRFFGVARAALRYAERLVSHDVTFRLLERLRVWFFARLEPLAPARLASHRSGDLLTRIVSDVETLQEAYLRIWAPAITAGVVIVTAIIAVAIIAPPLIIPTLAGLLLTGLAIPLLTRRLARVDAARQIEVRGQLSTELVDALRGTADVLAMNREKDFVGRLDARAAELGALETRQARVAALHQGLSEILPGLTMWTVLAMAIPLVVSGALDGMLLALVVLGVIAAFEAVQPLGAAFQRYDQSRRAAERLVDVIDAEPAVREPTQPVSVNPSQPVSIRFEDVRFGYEDDTPILSRFNLEIPPGSRIAIVGPSGSGKSTLFNLLLRFHDPDAGKIYLGPHDLRAMTTEVLRTHFAVVTQRTHLFNTTLRQNLLIARDDATEADLWDALDKAGLADFVQSLPDGLDTLVGEAGQRLSGGERQRVAIARALLKDAPVLLLDEPTANLDGANERRIMATLERLTTEQPQRTVVMITHHTEILRSFDRILELHEPLDTFVPLRKREV